MKQHLLKEIEVGTKNALLKKKIITHYIYNGSSTITDLAKELDLSVPTVTKFISEMCEEGYINDYGKLETSGGRYPSLYGLNPESGYFIGVDIKKFAINIGLINFKGDMVELKMNIPFKSENTSEALEELCKLILQFIKNDGPMFLHQCSDDGFDGSFGRISIKRNDFLSIGGYNESLAPAGYQDLDLINRLMAKGYRRIEVKDSKYNRAIRNTKEEGIAFTHSSFKTWHEMDEYNAKISQSNILAGKLIANGGSFGIRKNIFDIEGNVPKEVDSLKYAHKISFNITCMNRLHHIKQTLQQNIHDNFLSEQVEFNLLDYNSTDGLERWVKQQGELFDTGIFNYYKTITPTCYHRTHSRNMAFRLSTGDIVCNLDADNYLGEGFVAYILNLFCVSDEKAFYTPRYSERDVIGRLCLWRKHFLSVNGYNEALPGYGLEDIELYYRLWKSGIEQEFILDFYRFDLTD